MTPEEYLASVYTALQREEQRVNDDLKPLLLLLLWRLRQSLIASLPDTGLSRQLILEQLLVPFELELRDYATQLRTILLQALEQVDRDAAKRAAAFAGVLLTAWVYKPRTGEALLSTTRTGGTTLQTLLTPAPGTNRIPFVDAHLRAIRAKILAGLMRGDSTIEIARTLVAERTRRGFVQPINARGTTFSALRNRDTALVANAMWDVSNTAQREIFLRQQRVTATTDTPFAPSGWIWNAVLDPATCPICRPLHNQRREQITQFPYIPPVHPRCRCMILPAPAMQ